MRTAPLVTIADVPVRSLHRTGCMPEREHLAALTVTICCRSPLGVPVVPAPDLVEVAQIWWDVERVPTVVWDPTGSDFHLADPDDPSSRLLLARFSEGVADPREVAQALAEGLAACDFPPNGDGVVPERARRTLNAAGIRGLPADGRARST